MVFITVGKMVVAVLAGPRGKSINFSAELPSEAIADVVCKWFNNEDVRVEMDRYQEIVSRDREIARLRKVVAGLRGCVARMKREER